jgi:hypothetical protein
LTEDGYDWSVPEIWVSDKPKKPKKGKKKKRVPLGFTPNKKPKKGAQDARGR